MSATDILRLLPATLEWMVFFRLSAIRPWAHDTQMKAMFFLPEQTSLDPFTSCRPEFARTFPGAAERTQSVSGQ